MILLVEHPVYYYTYQGTIKKYISHSLIYFDFGKFIDYFSHILCVMCVKKDSSLATLSHACVLLTSEKPLV